MWMVQSLPHSRRAATLEQTSGTRAALLPTSTAKDAGGRREEPGSRDEEMEDGEMATVLVPGTKLAVFAIRRTEKGPTVWVRAGNGFVNKDGSLNLWLDVLPLEGQLHIREAASGRRDSAPPPEVRQQPSDASAGQEEVAQAVAGAQS